MTKEKFFFHVGELYKAMNMADSHDNPDRAPWMHPNMAGDAGCAKLDAMLNSMVDCGAISPQERQTFHDDM